MDRGEVPLVRVWGTNGTPRWVAGHSKIAFVSERGDHSFIGVYDLKSRTVTYMAPAWIATRARRGRPTAGASPSSGGPVRHSDCSRRAAAPASAIRLARRPRRARPGAARGWRPARRDGGSRAGRAGGVPDCIVRVPGGYTCRSGSPIRHREAREFWHNRPDDPSFSNVNAIDWAGSHVIFQAEPEEWVRYYSVSIAAARQSRSR